MKKKRKIFVKKTISIVAILLCFMTQFVFSKTTLQKSDTFSMKQQEEIEKIIHDYLLNKNPHILTTMLAHLEEEIREKKKTALLRDISKNSNALFNDPHSPYAGVANAKVTLIEFFDYQCGHCSKMSLRVAQLLKNKSTKVIFKEWPIFGEHSEYAARAALASVNQKKYVAFNGALFKIKPPLTKVKVLRVAKQIGLNVSQLKKDMRSSTIKQQLLDNRKLASLLKVSGTPFFIIRKQSDLHEQPKIAVIPGAVSLEDLKKLTSFDDHSQQAVAQTR